MSAANDVRHDLAGKLAAAGLPATTDPRAVAPFVLVGEPTMLGPVGIGGWTLEVPVHVVAPAPGDEASLEWRLEQAEAVCRVVGADAYTPDVYGAGDLPAYLVRVLADVTNPDC